MKLDKRETLAVVSFTLLLGLVIIYTVVSVLMTLYMFIMSPSMGIQEPPLRKE